MIIKVAADATEKQIDQILAKVSQMRRDYYLSLSGVPRIIGVYGDDEEAFIGLSGVEGVEKIFSLP